MADPFSRVSPGQPLRIPAEAYNAMIEAARANRGGAPDVGSGSFVPPTAPHGSILLRNDSAKDVPQWGFLGIGDPLPTYAAGIAAAEFDRNPRVFGGEDPDSAEHADRFAIAAVASPAGATTAFMTAGIFPATIDVSSEGHEYAVLVTGEVAKLASAATGAARIVWKETGTGEKRALVYISALAAQGGGSFSVVQAVADGAAGVVSTKAMAMKADPAASPNYTLDATATNKNYFKL